MASSREVVTLQLGHFANFVGAHWWNLQESSFVYSPKEEKEINHDVLYREGENLKGEVTYTPRLVSFDLKGCLNHLPKEGALYDIADAGDDIPWQSDITMHKMAASEKNEFLQDLEAEDKVQDVMDATDKEQCIVKHDASEQPSGSSEEPLYLTKVYSLENKIKVWSDFLRVHFHPKTNHIVEQYQHGGDIAFDVFNRGLEIYKDYDTQADIEDKLHFFLEECDHLQGIQLLVDSHTGFGGIASGLLQDLVDDYGNKAIFSVSAIPTTLSLNKIRDESHRAVNNLLSLHALHDHSTSILPLSVPKTNTFQYLNYNADLAYHCSSIIAASLDSATMPYRHATSSSSMLNMLQSLSMEGRKLLTLQSSFPYPLYKQDSLVDSLLGLDGKQPWNSLTPMCQANAKPWAQSVTLRGLPSSRLHSKRSNIPSILQQCTTVREVLQLYLSEISGTKLNHVISLNAPLQIQSPFPHIFKPEISSSGEIGIEPRSNDEVVRSVLTMTSLQSSSASRHYLNQVLLSVKNFNIKRFHKFLEAGLEEDDYAETMSRLQAVAELYET